MIDPDLPNDNATYGEWLDCTRTLWPGCYVTEVMENLTNRFGRLACVNTTATEMMVWLVSIHHGSVHEARRWDYYERMNTEGAA